MLKLSQYQKIIFLVFLTVFFISCKKNQKKTINNEAININKIESKKEAKSVADEFILNDENAIPFFYEYDKKNKENKIRIETKFGNIDILLFSKTPYHRSNFIYLTKKNILMALHFIEW